MTCINDMKNYGTQRVRPVGNDLTHQHDRPVKESKPRRWSHTVIVSAVRTTVNSDGECRVYKMKIKRED